jgi:uncharacterized protein (DUF1501 family)
VRPTTPSCAGCDEYHYLTRRGFLGLTAGALGAAALPAWLPRVAYATSHDASRDVLVSIVLQGGCDALSLCPPFGDPGYYRQRPTLAIPPPDSRGGARALDLDGYFGLAPALEPLLEAYQEGSLLIVHACGLPQSTRSHFHAIHSLEVGVPNPPQGLTDGWIARHLQAVTPDPRHGLLRAASLGSGLPRRLVGAPATLSLPSPSSSGLLADFDAGWLAALEAIYDGAAHLQPVAATSLRTLRLLDEIDLDGYLPAGGAAYPEDSFGRALRSTAALIRADVGVEAATLELHGWDTHDLQGPLDGGMASLMGRFARALAAFHRDLFSAGRQDVTVVVASEFGRGARENGSGGTEHGYGGVMLLLGGSVVGGRVLARWPGLEDELLHEGRDLPVTVDARDVLVEVLARRLGNPDWHHVFPDPRYSPSPLGAVR